MIENVDNYIKERLERIKYGSGSLRVYPYIPDRSKGETQYPCVAFERMYQKVDMEQARPNAELFIPSVAQTTLTDVRDYVTRSSVSDVTGPASYRVKPYPTPMVVTYELHALGTKKNHADGLMENIYQAFPPAYSDVVDGHDLTFWIKDGLNENDLSIPLYRTMVLMDVTGLWLDRLESLVVPSITSVGHELIESKKEGEEWLETPI